MPQIVGLTRPIVVPSSRTSFVMSALLFVAAAAQVAVIVLSVPSLGLGSHEATVALTASTARHADTVLVAALLITAIGYGLFVGEVAKLPSWLEIRTLEDLKDKLVSVVVAVLAVNFFTLVVKWDGGLSFLYRGAATGLVIASLAAYGSSVTHTANP